MNFLPGDWMCPQCDSHNFSRNMNCRDCGIVRPNNADKLENYRSGGGENQKHYTNNSRYSSSNNSFGMVNNSIPLNFMPGDWMCSQPKCQHHNFARNLECRRCGAPKYDNAGSISGSKFVSHDWYCPNADCGYYNFARVSYCRMCDTPRPENTVDSSQDHRKGPLAFADGHSYKLGDWTCALCSEHNFARRLICRKCYADKSQIEPARGENDQNVAGEK
ncbi:uncharacterized protein LOC135121820 [Zophobas morio]|uniref:uncharacterized protein LOC135121820 n=1 Tax=Zophobas morio TaxID=2755281 RepID=UPI0030836938